MEYIVLLDEDFEKWLNLQEEGLQTTIISHVNVLSVYGPALGRPRVDTITGSKLSNLKELRVQYKGEPWRILFVFDPLRQIILLVGGNKQGNKRWYKQAIPLAERRYERHKKELEKEKKHGKETE